MAVTLEILDSFNSKIWKTAEPLSAPGSTVLLTWQEIPFAVDAGIPDDAARVLGDALCSLGPVVYAGDKDTANPEACRELAIRKLLRKFTIALYCATSSAALMPAFKSSTHNWTMNAQWLIVVDSPAAVGSVDSLVRQLFEDWTLPDPLPPRVLMVVQAAVDGDGAASHSADVAVREKFLKALRESAERSNIQIRIKSFGHGGHGTVLTE